MEQEQKKQTEQYAGFWIRVLALLLDGIVVNAAVTLIFLIFGFRQNVFNLSGQTSASLLYGGSDSYITTLIQWAYNIVMLKYYGATLGKMALKIKVVGKSGELDWVTAILRETVGKFASAIILGIGFLMVAWDPKKQGLHDKIAGTFVIKE